MQVYSADIIARLLITLMPTPFAAASPSTTPTSPTGYFVLQNYKDVMFMYVFYYSGLTPSAESLSLLGFTESSLKQTAQLNLTV